jgi:hypothetical protein
MHQDFEEAAVFQNIFLDRKSHVKPQSNGSHIDQWVKLGIRKY